MEGKIVKKIIKILLFVFISCFTLNVYAENYATMELIPVDTNATIDTETFLYQDMIFYSNADAKGNSLIRFASIQNHQSRKIPISINLLLFDEDEKNIGFLTYCSDKDIDSDYAKYQIGALQAHAFAINVTTKYYVEDKGVADTKYVAVYDDNPYCHIGGYSKYEGKTLEEIVEFDNITEEPPAKKMDKILSFLKTSPWVKIFGLVIVGLIILSITGNIINRLYYKLYRTTTNLAYIPFLNFYICMKLSFGGLIGIGYLIFMIIAILFWLIKVSFFMYLVYLGGGIAFLVVIVKLITKRYELLFFEPNINIFDKNNKSNHSDNLDNYDQSDNSNNFINIDEFSEKEKDIIMNEPPKEEVQINQKEELKELKRKEKEAKRLAKIEAREMKKQARLEKKKKKSKKQEEEVVENNNQIFAQSLIDSDKKEEDNNTMNVNPLAELNLNYNSTLSNDSSDTGDNDQFEFDLNLDDDDNDE